MTILLLQILFIIYSRNIFWEVISNEKFNSRITRYFQNLNSNFGNFISLRNIGLIYSWNIFDPGGRDKYKRLIY